MTIPLHKPHSKEMLFFLISGIIVSIPLTVFINNYSGYLFFFVPSNYVGIFSVVLLAPLIEEFSKAYPLFYRHAETERSIFTLGFLVGLGFGIVELVEYVVLLQVPLLVRLPAVFFHGCTTSIIAYGIAKKQPVGLYIVAVALHMSNNLLAEMGDVWIIGGPLIIGLTYLLTWFFYDKTKQRMIPF
jgi:hypothetical protein